MMAILRFYGKGRQFNDHMSPHLEVENTIIRAYDLYKLRDKVRKLEIKFDSIKRGHGANLKDVIKFANWFGAKIVDTTLH